MMNKNYRIHRPLGWVSAAILVLLAAVSITLASEHAAGDATGVSDVQKLGEEVHKRLTTYSDEKTFTLEDGETARMEVKDNIALVSAIEITPHIVEDGTRFDIEVLDENGNAVHEMPAATVIHDGNSHRTGTNRQVGGEQILCKVQLTPDRRDAGDVVVELKALFTKVGTPEEIEALLATQGKEGQVQLDFMEISPAVMQYKHRNGQYPWDLELLGQQLPKDAYSPDKADYHYEAEGTRFILSSCGEDGIYGNDDDQLLITGLDGSQSGYRHEVYPLAEESIQAPLAEESFRTQRESTDPDGRRPKGNASISGRVVEAATGDPVPHAKVHLFCPGTLDSIFIDVASDGSFEFEGIPGGAYALRVINTAGYVALPYNPEDRPSKYPQFSLEEGEQRTDILFELQRAYRISGRVLTEDGGPLPATGPIWVLAWAETGSVDSNGSRHEIVKQTIASFKDGAYLLDELDGRAVYVMVLDFVAQQKDDPYQPTYYPGTFSRDDATQVAFHEEGTVENVDIALRTTGGQILEGTVTSRATGEPVPKALVVVHHKDMLFDRATAYTNEEGHYRFECLGPGEFLVHIDATPWGLVRTRKAVNLSASDVATQVDVSLLTGVTISGQVLDEAGEPSHVHEHFGSARVKGQKHKGGSFSGVQNKYAPVGSIQHVSYFPGEGDYESVELTFLDDSSFVVNGMMPGQVFLSFNPYTEGKTVLEILHDGGDISDTGLEAEPGQVIADVAIVIGAAEDS